MASHRRGSSAFTFQEKAAAELKQRIDERCREQLGEVHGMAEMYVGTIHGFCLDLLKAEVPEYLKYDVLNEVQQPLFRGSQQSKERAHGDHPARRACASAVRRYQPLHGGARHPARVRLWFREIAGCFRDGGARVYRALLGDDAYFDYAAMMERAVRVLEDHGEVRERLRERIKHVIVDEYQDVNPIQERVIRLLHDLGADACVIGDDDQTIHQWRGSDVENIITFEDRYPSVTSIRLQENFRSSPGVIDPAREFIAQNTHRLPKAMIPAAAQAYEEGDVAALRFDTPGDEAEWIVDTIRQLRGVAFREGDTERGLAYSDMAILLRSVRRNAQPITDALQAAGIPFVVSGMNNLFETAEAQAARELFYFVAGPGRQRAANTRADVLAAWFNAGLGITLNDLDRALDNVERTRRRSWRPRIRTAGVSTRFSAFI